MGLGISRALLACAFLSVGASNVVAGVIIASGDSTPMAYAGNPNNNVFFSNVLGSGKSVVVHESPNDYLGTTLSDYYSSLAGVSSTYINNGEITAAMLSGVHLFVTSLYWGALSASEVSILNSFRDGGGSLMFMGEYTNPFTDINSALAALGSSMQLFGDPVNSGTHSATVLADPLTTGVSRFSYGYGYGVSGGTPLFIEELAPSRVFMAYENTNVIPEPGTLALLGFSLVGLAAMRKRMH